MSDTNNMNESKPLGADKKIPAGVLGILLGGLGIHKFFLGLYTPGIIMLTVTLFASHFVHIAPAVIYIIGLIEGITYLTKSDEEFSKTYIIEKKNWF